uniref:Uncharacterized protein n=1 Tax=Anguilla anguilla TaxID=7936 RepID=A0A0E9WDT0_ANGAN
MIQTALFPLIYMFIVYYPRGSAIIGYASDRSPHPFQPYICTFFSPH